jgi:hypothetical protein
LLEALGKIASQPEKGPRFLRVFIVWFVNSIRPKSVRCRLRGLRRFGYRPRLAPCRGIKKGLEPAGKRRFFSMWVTYILATIKPPAFLRPNRTNEVARLIDPQRPHGQTRAPRTIRRGQQRVINPVSHRNLLPGGRGKL